MTAQQLGFDDCEPAWDDLCDLGAQQLHNPTKPGYWDLRGQGLTALQIHTIETIKMQGSYL